MARGSYKVKMNTFRKYQPCDRKIKIKSTSITQNFASNFGPSKGLFTVKVACIHQKCILLIHQSIRNVLTKAPPGQNAVPGGVLKLKPQGCLRRGKTYNTRQSFICRNLTQDVFGSVGSPLKLPIILFP
jgi:hypothetical protein